MAAYRLPTDRRGLVQIGPLQVVVGDPFGLTSLATVAAPTVALTVYPHIDQIDPLPYTTGHDPLAGARQPNSLGRTGEDFYALRPYVVGDDLRRIHWPSSARHDELLVRQNELPWQGRTTVLLDVRKAAHSGDSLEVAVSAAASIVAATARRNDLIRLVTTAGTDSDFAPGSDHVEAIMEHLAVVPASPTGSLRRIDRDARPPVDRRRARRARRRGARRRPARPRCTSRAATDPSRSCTSTARPGTRARPSGRHPTCRCCASRATSPFATAWNAHVRTLHPTRTGDGRSRADDRAATAGARRRGAPARGHPGGGARHGRLFDGGGWLGPAGRQRRRRPRRRHGAATPRPVAAGGGRPDGGRRRHRRHLDLLLVHHHRRSAHGRHLVGDERRPRRRVGRSTRTSCAPAPVAPRLRAGQLPRAVGDRLRGRLGGLPAVGALRGHAAGQHPVPVHRRCSGAPRGRGWAVALYAGGAALLPARPPHGPAGRQRPTGWPTGDRSATARCSRPAPVSAWWPCWRARSSDRRSPAPAPPASSTRARCGATTPGSR